MAEFWEKSDKFFFVPVLFSIFAVLIIAALFLVTYNRLPPKLPLFYSLPWGQPQLVAKQQLLLLPAILILITLINSLLASQLHPVQVVIKRTLTLSLALINLIILITALKIIFIFI